MTEIKTEAERVEIIEALEPIVAAYEAGFRRYERVNSNWHHEMPGEWPIELRLTVADCRRARSLLTRIKSERDRA